MIPTIRVNGVEGLHALRRQGYRRMHVKRINLQTKEGVPVPAGRLLVAINRELWVDAPIAEAMHFCYVAPIPLVLDLRLPFDLTYTIDEGLPYPITLGFLIDGDLEDARDG